MYIDELKNLQENLDKEIFTTGNVDLWDKMMDENVVFHSPPNPDIVGLEPYKQYMRLFFQGISDLHYDVNIMIGEGAFTAQKFTLRFKHTGPNLLMPVTPSGKEFVYEGMMFGRWENDKICEAFHVSDMLGIFQQLGIIPKMGN